MWSSVVRKVGAVMFVWCVVACSDSEDDEKLCNEANAKLVALCGSDMNCTNDDPRALTLVQMDEARTLNEQV
jgi:hypothetical protein